jgi:hypothetical protein
VASDSRPFQSAVDGLTAGYDGGMKCTSLYGWGSLSFALIAIAYGAGWWMIGRESRENDIRLRFERPPTMILLARGGIVWTDMPDLEQPFLILDYPDPPQQSDFKLRLLGFQYRHLDGSGFGDRSPVNLLFVSLLWPFLISAMIAALLLWQYRHARKVAEKPTSP